MIIRPWGEILVTKYRKNIYIKTFTFAYKTASIEEKI
jgi:hypothetical protein